MALTPFHDTISAIATAEGRAALAIVRISGADAIAILSKIVSTPDALWAARGGSSIYTKIPHPQPPLPAGRGGFSAAVDDVVIHIFRAPRSFTGEDLCEITCHGSPVITEQILQLLIANGARQAEPGEFSQRAFFNGKIDIEEAELISIKANAQSEPELRGAKLALSEKFDRLRTAYNALITLIARIDAEIDFGDSDHIEIPDFAERIGEVSTTLNGLIQDSANRRENAGYFTVALTGPPNVGKSSIFNALLNFERSIVSDTPGTTRDYVEAFINIDGFRVKLIDTAGIREADESIEARGIALGTTAARHADISFRVTDALDRAPQLLNGDVLLHNKSDLDGWNNHLHISALTGQGVEKLHRWLAAELQARSSEFSQVTLSASEKAVLESVSIRLR
ncbi:MAG TPA: GTPase, partial [Candidatus Kapabacteria bacterium]|nr:GTPase [Candidatus Kapabacteria bacterium]